MRSLLENAAALARTASAKATDATLRITGAGIGAKDAVAGFGGNAIDKAVSVKDGVIDTRNAVVGYTTAAADVAGIMASGLAFKGFVVAAIVAPIPTLIGTLLIDVMLSRASDRINEASCEIEAKKLARVNNRTLEKLARYGRIPATALVETDSASLRLDTVAGTVSGHVKAGAYKDRTIEGMTDKELGDFSSLADAETTKLVHAYLRYKARTADA